MSRTTGSSRLLVKIAECITEHGEKGVEEHLDTILSKKNKKQSNKPVIADKRITAIIKIVSAELSIPVSKIKGEGRGEDVKFALSVCVYFIKIKLHINNIDIALYFKRSSHSFVNDYMDFFNEQRKAKTNIILRTETLIDNQFKN